MRRRYPGGVAAAREQLFALARTAFQEEERRYSPACMSGADLAEAPYYAGVRRFYEAVAMGEDPQAAAKVEDARWRSYAAENNAKIATAPKIQRGPMEGQSVIHHRYTSPEHFASRLPHLLAMVAICRGAR